MERIGGARPIYTAYEDGARRKDWGLGDISRELLRDLEKWRCLSGDNFCELRIKN